MSQYPILTDQGVLEAVNYLASGPSGLGQNFDGFSAYQPAYVTGNFRQPFTVSTATSAPPNWYIPPVSINSISSPDGQTVTWNFASTQPTAPFTNGLQLTGAGFTPSFYNGGDGGVVACTTSTVTTQFSKSYAPLDPITVYGTLNFQAYLDSNGNPQPVSTDCNARVTVTGPTERVFINSQLTLTSGYTCTTASTFMVTVQIDRYRGSVNTFAGSTDYFFNLDTAAADGGIVSLQSHTYSVGPGSGTVDTGQNIFTTVIDQPDFGYYWYIADIVWTPLTGNAVPKLQTVGLRSLTAQVIKQ
jgi:hypothetical protein